MATTRRRPPVRSAFTEADFYVAHHLPRVRGLAETVAAGEIG